MSLESSPRMLLVEDNPGDARYIRELLREAMAFSERSLARDGGGIERPSSDERPPADASDADGETAEVSDDVLVHETRLDDALDRLAAEDIDVVLLDLGLPDSQGLDTLTALVDAHPTMPIVVLTGLRDREVGIEALRQGAEEYLVKDEINPDLLIRSVHHAIERKAHEREQARYETLIEESTDANAIVDEAGTIQYVTPSVRNVLGYEPDELADEFAFEFVHPEDRQDAISEFERMVDDPNYRAESEFRFRHADGSWLVLRARGRNLIDDPTIEGFVVYTHDITDQKRRERRLEQQRERVAALNQLNSVVHGVTEAVIDRSTRPEIEQITCERIAAADSYAFAWIGEPEAATQTLQARAEAGVEDYLADEEIRFDATDADDEGPIERAIRTGEVQTARRLPEASTFEPVQAAARRHEFRSTAAIPITHDDVTYGVLNVYTDRPDAFEAEERTVVAHLGEIVGHAIAAAERKQALMSDAVVELEFRIEDALDTLGFEQVPPSPITFEHTIPLPEDEFLVYGVTSADTIAAMESMTERSDYWKSVSVVGDDPDGVRFELQVTDPPLMSDVASLGGAIDHVTLQGRDLSLLVHLPPEVDVRQVIDTLQAQYPQAEPVARRQVSDADDATSRLSQVWSKELTDRQRTVLETAYFAGFFEWPRASSGEELADTLGISAPTLSEHLRAAERKVFAGLLGDTSEDADRSSVELRQ